MKLIIDLQNANKWYVEEVKLKLQNMNLRVKEE